NLPTLRQYGGAPATTDAYLFSPSEIIRGLDRASIDYYLKAAPKNLTLEILDGKGQVVRAFSGQAPRPAAATDAGDDDFPRGPATTVPMAPGLNRATWDLNSTPVMGFQGMILW